MAVIFISDGAGGLGITPVATTSLYNGPKSGSVEVSTSVKEHGYGSFVHDSAGGVSAYINRLACLADAGRRISMRVRFSAFPTTTSTIIRPLTGTSTLAEIRLDSSGNLRLYAGASGAALQATGTTVLSINTWYRITLSYTITNASTSEWRVYLDGALELTASNPASQPTGSNNLRIGWTGNNPGTSKLMYHQDLYIDDGTGLDDPGDIRVTSKRPAGTGASNAFDTVVGASANRWTAVSEMPATTTNMWRQAGSSQVAEQYTVQAASVGDDDITGKDIVCWAPWVYWSIVAAGGSTLVSMYADGSLVGLTSTSGSNVFQTMESIVASTSYPSGNDDVGLRSTGTTVDTNLAECGIFIAYKDAAGVAYETPSNDIALGTPAPTYTVASAWETPANNIALGTPLPDYTAVSPVAAEYGIGNYGIDYYNEGAAAGVTYETPSLTIEVIPGISAPQWTRNSEALVSTANNIALGTPLPDWSRSSEALVSPSLNIEISLGVSAPQWTRNSEALVSPANDIAIGTPAPTYNVGVAYETPANNIAIGTPAPTFTWAGAWETSANNIALGTPSPTYTSGFTYTTDVINIDLGTPAPTYSWSGVWTTSLNVLGLGTPAPTWSGVWDAYTTPLNVLGLGTPAPTYVYTAPTLTATLTGEAGYAAFRMIGVIDHARRVSGSDGLAQERLVGTSGRADRMTGSPDSVDRITGNTGRE